MAQGSARGMNPACTELLLLGFSTNLYRGLTREIKDQLAWAQQREALPSLKCLFLSVYVLLGRKVHSPRLQELGRAGKGLFRPYSCHPDSCGHSVNLPACECLVLTLPSIHGEADSKAAEALL